MKRPTPRPAAALVLTATAVFTLLGNRCGLLGQLLTACLAKLLGVPGTALLVVTQLTVAFVLAFPGTLARLAQRFVNVEPRFVKVDPVNKDQSPRERMARQDVRTALKSLGYLIHEIDPVLAKLDPALPFEKAVKAALKQLNNIN